MAHIETIESRTLFAATVPEALIQLAEASASPAVQATLDRVKADLTAINDARRGDSRTELQQIIESGLAQLGNARDALRAVRNADPVVREASIETLKSTRKEIKATIAAAKANLRSSVVENRAELREATTSLRQNLKQLRRDLRSQISSVGSGSSTSAGSTVTGFNGGTWTGSGISSSVTAAAADLGYGVQTIGYIDASPWAGPAGLDANDVIVKHTYYGDADLGGTVDLDDFAALLQTLKDDNTGWAYGDFNYNGTIDLDDFGQFLANYDFSGMSPEVQAALANPIGR